MGTFQHHTKMYLNWYTLLCIVYIRIIIVFVVSSCILVSHTNKLKKWIFYIYLLTTITKALYQSSDCPYSSLVHSITVEERAHYWAAAAQNVAALYCTHYAIYFYQIESYHSSLSCGPLSMHFNGTLILLYFIEMLPHMVSSSPYLKLSYFNLPNQCIVLSVTRVKF